MKSRIFTSVFLITQVITTVSISTVAQSSNTPKHKIGFTSRDASECGFWLPTDRGKIKQNIVAVSRSGIYMNIDGSDIELKKSPAKGQTGTEK